MSSRALIIFGRNPVPGRVKTRLAENLGAKAAAELYEAFLVDTLARCKALGVPIRLYLSPFRGPLRPAVEAFEGTILTQRGRGLGRRMENAISETLAAGYERVVLIGSDHPTLPLSRIRTAFELLDRPETVVLGPSLDGGYHLIGLSDRAPKLFHGMSYGHALVLKEVISRARSSGLRTATLEPWYDVDTMDDLRRLALDLESADAGCPLTRSRLVKAGLIENTSFDAGSASEK